MNKLYGFVSLVIGGFLLWGVKRKWRWLVDPPDDLSAFYSQSFLKENVGPDAPRLFATFLGIGLIVLGVIFVLFG